MPTPADVAQIRLRWASGDLTQAAIGALFDVNQGAVSNSVNYRSHVAVPCVQVVAELVEPAVAARPVGASRLLPAGSLALPPVR
jgi:hypothetical protein